MAEVSKNVKLKDPDGNTYLYPATKTSLIQNDGVINCKRTNAKIKKGPFDYVYLDWSESTAINTDHLLLIEVPKFVSSLTFETQYIISCNHQFPFFTLVNLLSSGNTKQRKLTLEQYSDTMLRFDDEEGNGLKTLPNEFFVNSVYIYDFGSLL